ncbi:unnamed protein product, partial [Sphacelaria rigidula]
GTIPSAGGGESVLYSGVRSEFSVVLVLWVAGTHRKTRHPDRTKKVQVAGAHHTGR